MLAGCNELLQPPWHGLPLGKARTVLQGKATRAEHLPVVQAELHAVGQLWVGEHLYPKGQCSKVPKASLMQAQGSAVQGQEWGNPKTSRHRHWQRL